MFRILRKTVVSSVAATGLAAAFATAGGPALARAAAASAAIRVPCAPATLASDISSAASGATLALAAGCRYGLAAALPTVSQDLTIEGNGATLARSSTKGTPAFTILTVTGGTLTVSRLSFTNGRGGIAVLQSASLSVTGGTFSGNQAPQGGAIDLDGSPHKVTITGVTFTGNTTSGKDGQGGAFYNGLNAGTAIAGSTFIRNTAGQGGAIFDFAVGGASITGTTFTENHAKDGGAILNDPIGGEYLTNDTIKDNSASQDGGGIYGNEATVTVRNSVISGNQAGADGGGIYQQGVFSPRGGSQLTSDKLTGNRAAAGGGLYDNASFATFTGATISGNRATASGGGVENLAGRDGSGSVSFMTSKVTGNQAGTDGGGVYNAGTMAASNTSIMYNRAAGGGGIYDGPGLDTVTLARSRVQHNTPDNCEPAGSIPCCRR
jgi:hypothetical protein